MGLFGYALPSEYGGLGANTFQDALLAIEFGYTTPAFRSMFGTNNGIAGQFIARFGDETQRDEYLPQLASGRLVASFGLTEAEAGSNPAAVRTEATRISGGWTLNGVKRFITNAPSAGLFVIFARVATGAPVNPGVTAFLVRAGSSGLSVGPPDRKMGQNAAPTAEVVLSDVTLSDSAVVGPVGGALRLAFSVLSRGRLHVAGMCVGAGVRILEESIQFASLARTGDQFLRDFQLVQAMIADSHVDVEAGRAVLLEAARRFDEDIDTVVGPSTAKLFCSEMVSRVADRGVQLHGGAGYMQSSVVERMYRDSRLFRIYEGTSEVQRINIGTRLLRDAAKRSGAA